MSEGKRSRLSLTQRTEIWRRWKSGQSLHEIGRAFGKPHSCIRCLLLPRGGIPPAARRRSPLALTLAEREDISRGLASGSLFREIARHLDRAASTLSREVARHGGRSVYRAHEADEQAWDSALRPKQCLLALHARLREIVASKLILDWSPEQISGWLKTEYPDDGSMHVSHETIYRSLFIQARGVLKKRAAGPPAVEAAHAPLAPCNGQRTVPGSDRRCHLDPRKACGSGRSSDSRSLGRRSAERCQEQLHCNPGRTSLALCHAAQGAEQRNRSCGCCLESACS
jgi:hypothetical protein